MPLVMNATCEVQKVQAFGNMFTLQPGQIKNFNDNIAVFLTNSKRDYGLVGLPDEFAEDPAFATSDAGKELLAQKKAEGIANRIAYLKSIVYNLQVSLKADLEVANLKVDPFALASDGEIACMEELAKYQDKAEDESKSKVDKLKKLSTKIGKVEKN